MKRSIALMTLISCSILPSNYRQSLVGTWTSIEPVAISGGGTQDIIYTMVYSVNGSYRIDINHPVYGISTLHYTYKTGYLSPHPAIILLNPITLQVAALPIYYYFSNGMLVTSTNSNFRLNRIWTYTP